ncbi:unnamed protein product, partial [Hapterophycus canaliculatus]
RARAVRVTSLSSSVVQLVELLEVPQLMDACVRSDLLEEALSIATFASTLERRHRSRRAASMATR